MPRWNRLRCRHDRVTVQIAAFDTQRRDLRASVRWFIADCNVHIERTWTYGEKFVSQAGQLAVVPYMEVGSTWRHARDKFCQAPPLSRATLKRSGSLETRLLLTLTAKHRQRVTAIIQRFFVRLSICLYICMSICPCPRVRVVIENTSVCRPWIDLYLISWIAWLSQVHVHVAILLHWIDIYFNLIIRVSSYSCLSALYVHLRMHIILHSMALLWIDTPCGAFLLITPHACARGKAIGMSVYRCRRCCHRCRHENHQISRCRHLRKL